MQPPDNGNDTDEDSGSEDSGGNIDILTGRQLRAGAVTTVPGQHSQGPPIPGFTTPNVCKRLLIYY